MPTWAEKRQDTHDALVAAATTLVADRGFEETSVEAIAEAAGVSRRTFFRYFATKHDAVLEPQWVRLRRFGARLREGPEPAGWARVRAALLEAAEGYEADRERVVRERTVVDASFALQAAELEVDRAWEEHVAAHLATTLPARDAAVWAGAVVGAVRALVREWTHGAAFDLVAAGREALDTLEAGLRPGRNG